MIKKITHIIFLIVIYLNLFADIQEIDTLNKMSQDRQIKNPKQSIEYARKAFLLAQQLNYEKGEANALLNIVIGKYSGFKISVFEHFDTLDASENINKALILFIKISDKKGIADAKSWNGMVLLEKSELNKSIEMLSEALQIYNEISYEQGQAFAYFYIGFNYKIKSDIGPALKYFLESYKIAKKNSLGWFVSASLFQIGNLYVNKAQYKKALEYFISAEKASKFYGEKRLESLSLNNIGNVYLDAIKNNNEALEFYKQSLKISNEIKNEFGTAISIASIGRVFFNQKKYKESLEYFFQSLKLFDKLNRHGEKYDILFNVGNIFFTQNDFDNAKKYYFQALEIALKIDFSIKITQIYNQLGVFYLQIKSYNLSAQFFEKSLTIAKEKQLKEKIIEIYKNLSLLNKQMGSYKKALLYLELYSQTKDEVFNSEKNKQLTELQTQYETEKKEQEISNLKKDQTIKDLELTKKELALKQARAQRIAWISGFLLIFIVLIFLFLRYRRYLAFWKKEKTIGKYKLIERIGFGGFGKIHKALDSDTKTIVAIKELHENQMDEEAVKRFQSEGIIIERLHHPNIVKFIDKGEINNKAYIVMEYIDGITLGDKIKLESPIDISVCEHIAKQLASVIQHLHERNIIHRDLKPSNIMLVKNETPFPDIKLLDFGIAKTKFFTKLTETGIIPGTIYYMSPEQKNESPSQLKASCDIFSLGLMFYEMYTGIYPYEEESDKGIEILSNAINNRDPKPPRECRPDIPEAIEQLIARMIQKSANLRPSAEQVMKDLGIEIVKEEDE